MLQSEIIRGENQLDETAEHSNDIKMKCIQSFNVDYEKRQNEVLEGENRRFSRL